MNLRRIKKSKKGRDSRKASEATAPAIAEQGQVVPATEPADGPAVAGPPAADVAPVADVAAVADGATVAAGVAVATPENRPAPEDPPAAGAEPTPAATADVADTSEAVDESDTAERVAIAELMYKAAAERAEIAEAMYKAALTRGELAEARERAATERSAALEARERAAVERDSIANSRDRTAVERDSIANTRDKASVERESIVTMRITKPRHEGVDPTDEAALERARLEAELQRAHLDALTGVFRREMGRLALRNEIERARRADGKFVIAFIDVDGLKGVNDREGHAAGDRILRTLAATMRANLRSYDPIVRFGGDEFICGISSIDTGEVQHRIGVIDQSLRNATGVGITAGLAEMTANESLDELTAKADAALIEAKRHRDD